MKLIGKQEEIASHKEISRYFNTEEAYAQSKKPKKRYIPDMSHPWKKDNFMKHVYAMGEHKQTGCADKQVKSTGLPVLIFQKI